MVEIPTLQEASMLWIVMHIAMTVKTGDQPSLPNMDAQIYVIRLSMPEDGVQEHTYMPVRVYVLSPMHLI